MLISGSASGLSESSREDQTMAIASINDGFGLRDNGDDAEVPERRGKALMAWVNGPDVRNVFYGSAITAPPDVETFVAIWEAAQATAPTVPLSAPVSLSIADLPESVASQAQALVQSEQFRTHYQPFGVGGIGVVELADLITPQVWVDEQYVDELVGELPANDDDHGLFNFCFPHGRLGRPSLLGTSGGAFISKRRQIGGLTPVRVSHHSPKKVTFEFDVIPRANWLSVGIIETGRVVLRNGVHHALALLRSGRRCGFFLLQSSPAADLGLNYQDPGLFKLNRLLAPRPPLLRDYLEDTLATPVAVRTMDQYFKFAVMSEPGFLPRFE
jgi:hypothetical protein